MNLERELMALFREQYTTGRETVSGNAVHLREGVVITPVVERSCAEIGRLALKSVSEAYLMRKGNGIYLIVSTPGLKSQVLGPGVLV